MRQPRLSIACEDWMRNIREIGPAATGLLLYMRTMMRTMCTSELIATENELAIATQADLETTRESLRAILDANLLDARTDLHGVTTYSSREEAAALAERFRKRRQKLNKSRAEIPEHTLFDRAGNSGRTSSLSTSSTTARVDEVDQTEQARVCDNREYTCENALTYSADAGNSDYTFFDYGGGMDQKKKAPQTPKKEKSLTEPGADAHTSGAREISLPVDDLEGEFIDVIGSMPDSMRTALQAEDRDIREAFYLYCRKHRNERGNGWGADAMRAAWLAARRIPQERRADSILAAYMGNWKTIRDAGSGCYFERTTGRVVSLVRGPVEYHGAGGTASTAALGFLKRMREE